MLELRPNCESCDIDLPNGGAITAYICTFECTFCADCTDMVHKRICPNCGGDLVIRPTRPEALLERFPPSTKRVLKK